jgi:hypothetical protein
MKFRSHHQTLITFLLKIREREWDMRKKYPDDMVENLAESLGMCSDGPGSAPIEIPKERAFSWERARKKEGWRSLAVWERERRADDLSPRDLGPTCARHAWTVRDAPADGPRGARTVRYFHQNVQYLPSCPRTTRTVRAAPAEGPLGTAGQSGPLPRTVRPAFSSAWYILR